MVWESAGGWLSGPFVLGLSLLSVSEDYRPSNDLMTVNDG